MSKYLTRKQVVECYPISLSHLAHMACQGRGPKFRKIGKSAIYRIDEVEAWIEEQAIEPCNINKPRKRGRPLKRPSSPLDKKGGNHE